MATPTLIKYSLQGALGPILVDVRTSGREAPRPAVIVLHGFKGFKDWGMFPPLADRLARAGFTAVSFNVSGSGVDDAGEFVFPDRFGHNTFGAELHDLGRVIEALEDGTLGVPPPSRLGVIGHSRGGGMAVLRAAGDLRIHALVTWAAISHVRRWPEQEESWRRTGRLEVLNSRTGQILPLYTDVLEEVARDAEGPLDIPAAASRIGIPWLILHGGVDPTVPVAEARTLAGAARTPILRLLVIEGAGHTFGAVQPFAGMTPALGEAMDETLKWMGRYL